MTPTSTTIQDPATAKQKQLIHLNTPTKDIKEEWVQWATQDVAKTSCNELTFTEANLILKQLGLTPHTRQNWGVFDKNNAKHKIILSQVISIGWTTDKGYADMLGAFDTWLKTKSPVKKPLKKMTAAETEKVIKALQGVFKSTWK